MSEGNQTWPEQNAVDEWCEKHAAKGPLGSWYIYADFNILMELKKAVTAYRITVDKERDALKARVVELEQSDNETIKALSAKVASLSTHETCACSIDTPEDVCMHHSPEVMRLRKRVAEFEAARQWQPIATAPDEQAVLLYISASHYIAIGYYDGETWQLESGPTDEKPTHWMPLPEPLK